MVARLRGFHGSPGGTGGVEDVRPVRDPRRLSLVTAEERQVPLGLQIGRALLRADAVDVDNQPLALERGIAIARLSGNDLLSSLGRHV